MDGWMEGGREGEREGSADTIGDLHAGRGPEGRLGGQVGDSEGHRRYLPGPARRRREEAHLPVPARPGPARRRDGVVSVVVASLGCVENNRRGEFLGRCPSVLYYIISYYIILHYIIWRVSGSLTVFSRVQLSIAVLESLFDARVTGRGRSVRERRDRDGESVCERER
jgi:hypothetical protein